MPTPLPPLGPNPLNRAIQLANLDAHNARILATIITETSDVPDREHPTLSLLGDELQLRGIPCLSKGIGSHIHGTSPLAALLAKQPQDPC